MLSLNRRQLLALLFFAPFLGASREAPQFSLPPIGMGTWITFNVGDNKRALKQREEVLKEFFRQGGGLIDSSPMYGSAEKVLGTLLPKMGKDREKLISASKVWTSSSEMGPKQIQNSFDLWGLKKFDLFQIHNLLGWKQHLKTLQEMKESGKIKTLGITTSHGRRHDDFYKIMKNNPLDFIQVTYNVLDREVEKKILPLAKEKGIRVIANRPYQGGQLIKTLKKKPLPAWAKDMELTSWAQVLLKFITSHPAVDCAIPATSQVEHMSENMQARHGKTLSPSQREKISREIAQL